MPPVSRPRRAPTSDRRVPSLRFTVSLVVTGRVADEIDGMRRALGARSLLRIAPHITLVPPVNVAEPEVPAVLDQVRSAGEASAPITVALGGPATFAPRTPVVYLAVGGPDVRAIDTLRARLVTGALAPPPERSEREFVPHVTLDQRAERERIPVALAALADYRATFTFSQVTLLEQAPDKVWHPYATFPLAAPAVRARGGLELEVAVAGRLDPVAAGWAAGALAGAGEADFSVTGRRGGQLVGVVAGVVSGSICQVVTLVVAPGDRRQGIGAHLLQAVESHAAAARCAVVRVPAPAGGAGEALLLVRGYRTVARVPDPAGGPDLVLFERHAG